MLMRSAFSVFTSFVQLYTGLFILNVILSCVIIFMERRKPTSTLLWVMAINFLPIIGFVFYLFLGQDLSKHKMFDRKGQVDKEIKTFLQEQLDEMKKGTYEFENEKTKDYVEMIEMFHSSENAAFSQNNDIKIYNEGVEKFKDLFKDIDEAKNSIYIQYYILKSDGLGIELLEKLKKKAQEGVEVLLLVDGMGARNFSLKYRRDVEKAGVKLAIFFPGLLPRINTRINYRNHRKLAIIDHKIGYVGGLNVGDEYISKSKKFGFWRDTHFRILGPAVNGLQWRFFLDYRFAAKNANGGFVTPFDFNKKEGNKDICVVSSGPDTKAHAIRNGYSKMITRARKRVYIQTPYFVPDDGLLNDLKIAAMSGCEVSIMIPQKRDHPFVHWASMSFIGELLKWGVKAYLYQDGFLHSKVVISDDYLSSVGTANFDIRSFELNFEVNAFVFDTEINKELVDAFEIDVKKSKEITLEDYNNRNAIFKIKESISRLLSPLL